MTFPKGHWQRDEAGALVCGCPITGECVECGKPVTDHDLVGCWFWCGDCINKHLDEDKLALIK